MVRKLFVGGRPGPDAAVLDPGCGEGEFIEGVIEHCSARGWRIPRIVGIELDPTRAAVAARRFGRTPRVEIRRTDFLRPMRERFRYIVGNPPYVPITDLSLSERAEYRGKYATARGRFDLYLLFFEQAMRLLTPGGRLVFVTPEKYLYVETARPLRALLRERMIEELELLRETTFGDLVTYPLVTTVSERIRRGPTRIVHRDGTSSFVSLDTDDSWMSRIQGLTTIASGVTLADVSLRISCGVATGADPVFVVPQKDLPLALRRFAHPTIAGRQISFGGMLRQDSSMLAPYDADGRLLTEDALGALGRFLSEPARRAQLERRTCVSRKAWYAFHDNLPLRDLLRPKLLCKDITERPFFVIDRTGTLVPRHSVYYVVPADPSDLEPLAEYLNSEAAGAWLRAHCQRAANGFLRLQSHVLKRIPLPAQFAPRLGELTVPSVVATPPAARPA